MLRRAILLLAVVLFTHVLTPTHALAKGGGNDSQSSDDGDDGGDDGDDGGDDGNDDDDDDDDDDGGGDDGGGNGPSSSHPSNPAAAVSYRYSADEARLGVERGEFKPLSVVLGNVKKMNLGKVVSVELEKTPSANIVYNVVVIADDGAFTRVYLDARTSKVLAMRSR